MSTYDVYGVWNSPVESMYAGPNQPEGSSRSPSPATDESGSRMAMPCMPQPTCCVRLWDVGQQHNNLRPRNPTKHSLTSELRKDTSHPVACDRTDVKPPDRMGEG